MFNHRNMAHPSKLEGFTVPLLPISCWFDRKGMRNGMTLKKQSSMVSFQAIPRRLMPNILSHSLLSTNIFQVSSWERPQPCLHGLEQGPGVAPLPLARADGSRPADCVRAHPCPRHVPKQLQSSLPLHTLLAGTDRGVEANEILQTETPVLGRPTLL